MYDELKPSIRDTVYDVAAEVIKQAEGHFHLIYRCNGSDSRKQWFHENYVQTHIVNIDNNNDLLTMTPTRLLELANN